MPELPEVEVTRRGIAPALSGRRIAGARSGLPLRHPLGCPPEALAGLGLTGVNRRGKYLLLCLTGSGSAGPDGLIIHLGMSGSLRVLSADSPAHRHEHFFLSLDDGRELRLRDPRRFGAVVRAPDNLFGHPLLAQLGPEPLDPGLNAVLTAACAGRRTPVKAWLLDQHTVAGLGNIYVCEALFHAGIHPLTPAGQLGAGRLIRLTTAIRDTLTAAIDAGGSSLRDFAAADGRAGYFQQTLYVYGRTGLPCRRCGNGVDTLRLAGRSSFFCPCCQPAP